MILTRIVPVLLILMGLLACSDNDGLPQQADPDFTPKNTKISFLEGSRPTVLIDEAHNNFHTARGRYKPFVQVLESDGYIVKANKKAFALKNLKQADILVVSNALHEKNRWDWTPPYLHAFSSQEAAAIKQWVTQGGSLLLIVDHIPFPKAAEPLLDAFGFKFINGHVPEAIFGKNRHSLVEHAITTASLDSEPISQVKTFGGSAFQMPKNAVSLLTFNKEVIASIPKKAFEVTTDSPRISINGWSQGAVLELGKGRIAVFGEAAMFTSQIYIPTKEKSGFVSKKAQQNERFLLNVMHWLSHKL